MKVSWERGRPARTRPDTASAVPPAGIHREQRHGFAWTGPMGFLPAGWLPAASQGSSAAAQGERMRAGRPRSQGMPSRLCGGGWRPRSLKDVRRRQGLGVPR